MQYTKKDAKYIFGTFLVLFIAMILNFTISLPIGDVAVGLNIGIIFGTIFTMYRLRKYTQSRSVMILFVLLTISSLSFLIPLCMYNLLADLGPELEFVASLLLQPSFTPQDFNSMVESIGSMQGDLLLITSIQTIAMQLPIALTFVCLGYLIDEVGESCSLQATKKAKKNYVIAAISLVMVILFVILLFKFAFGVITYLHMEEDGTISPENLDNIVGVLGPVSILSFVVLIAIIVFIVFFIRGLVILNRAAKEIDSSNYSSNNPQDYNDDNQNDINE